MAKKKKKMTKAAIRRRRRKRLLVIEVLVLLLLLAVLFVWQKFGRISFSDLKNIATNDLDDETMELLSGYTTIALFGVDNRSNGNYDSGNSDSIMIACINNDTKEVKIVSVYRDTALDVDGDETIRKANYAYNHGGVEEAINMLNRNLDLDIEEYVAVDFYALANVVDALGGVEIEITSAELEYINAYIDDTLNTTGGTCEHITSTGTQTLNGIQAVAYCRIRYTDGGDFVRASRQRAVIEQIVEKAQAASLSELNEAINAVFDDVSTSLSISQILGLAASMSDYTLADTTGFPFTMATGTFGKRGSLDVPCTLESNVTALYEYLYGETDYVPSSTVQSISDAIVNLTGYTEDSAVEYRTELVEDGD